MLRAIPLPAFQDNYIWLLATDDGSAIVVDPGEAGPVLRAAADGIRPRAVLLTHHHADHVGGASALGERFGIPCHGPRDERIAAVDAPVDDGDDVPLPALGISLRVMAIPGHTRSHIAFHGAGHLFCGDTLFSLGCGRLFEGTPAQMLASLDRLATLPADTAVCCGHEYTEANARFARVVDPDNPALARRTADVAAARAAGRPSLPTRLGDERDANPFLRIVHPAVRRRVDDHAGAPCADRVAAFAELRRWKDQFP